MKDRLGLGNLKLFKLKIRILFRVLYSFFLHSLLTFSLGLVTTTTKTPKLTLGFLKYSFRVLSIKSTFLTQVDAFMIAFFNLKSMLTTS
jgi:hypothetical protein